MAPILLKNITFYENRNTDQNGELSIWVMLQRNLRKEQADSQYLFFRDSNMSLVRNQLLTFVWHPQVQITSSGSVLTYK